MTALRARFALWLLAVVLLSVGFFTQVLPGLRIETDITAMLPQLDDGLSGNPELREALDAAAERGSRQTLFLIGAPDFAQARAAAVRVAALLRASEVFQTVTLERGGDLLALDQSYGVAKRALLSNRHRELLAQGQAAQLGQEALRALYSPGGLMRPRPFAEDPLNLYGEFLVQQAPSFGGWQLREGLLTLRKDACDYVLLSAELKGNPFAVAVQQEAAPVLERARASAPDAQILISGVIPHAIANSERAAHEVSVFGSLSMLGVAFVLLLGFRSPRPLLLSLLSLGIGSMAAITICHLLFDQIHLLALVFGTSLVGVGVDYSMHFFADQFRDAPEPWSGEAALAHVGPAIRVGVLTAALGYLSFLVPPFPGLRQIAVLSVCGIATAALCVLLAYPVLAGTGRAPAAVVAQTMQKLASLRRPQRWPWLAVLLLMLCATGLARLRFVDDVRSFQASPPELAQQEHAARALLGGGPDSRFFLVTGKDAEAVLQAEEALRQRLDDMKSSGQLGSYTALSKAVPSRQRQRENEQWLNQQIYAASGVLPQLLGQIGYPDDTIEKQREQFASGQGRTLDLGAWLNSDASRPLRPLWLGQTAQAAASVVLLNGVQDIAALQALNGVIPGVRLVDRVADISATMQRFRELSQWGLALALLAIGIVLMLRYGWRDARRHVLAPLGACLLTLATLGLLGIPANLFSVLALLLVLGLGVDYSVFLEEGSGSRPTTLLAISMAGMTTLLAFGLLAVSATPFIASLGLAVLLGVAWTWLLAVLASAPANRDNLQITNAPKVGVRG